MEQYKDGQYDDDLTVGIDEYDEDFDTGAADLFEYVGDDGSPLARLKSIILSIDWEINDDILRQFNEELLDLKDIWAGNKVNLIYVQALEKISKYIYKEKANAHPKAIKLLLTFYTNLERIVSSDEMSEQEKKEVLVADVQRFEKLKKQISRPAPTAEPTAAPAPPQAEAKQVPEPTKIVEEPDFIPEQVLQADSLDPDNPLLNLKAIVYGIDWEITERDLTNLSLEVKALEKFYHNSKPKMIFLQGIGSLGAYINLKRSDSHADAFKLLHSFFTGLETVVKNNYTGLQEKEVLLPEVEKFNKFKAIIADTIPAEGAAQSPAAVSDESDEMYGDEIQPAFSDMPEDVHGFQEEEEAAALKDSEEDFVGDDYEEIDDEDDDSAGLPLGDAALANEMESRLSGMFDEPGKEEIANLDANVALQGVDVETDADDDSDEEPLPKEGDELAPALASEEDAAVMEESPAQFSDKLDDFFGEPDDAEKGSLVGDHIPGVDVETEADDDSEEAPLPFEGDEIAPALSSGFEGDDLDDEDDDSAVEVGEDEIDDRLTSLFDEQTDEAAPIETEEIADEAPSFAHAEEPDDLEDAGLTEEDSVAEEAFLAEVQDEAEQGISNFLDTVGDEESGDLALKGVDVESEADDDSDEEPLPLEHGEFAPALSVDDEDGEESDREIDFSGEEVPEEQAVSQQFDALFGDEQESESADVSPAEAEREEIEEIAEDAIAVESDDDVTEDDITSRFDDFMPQEESSISDRESLALQGVDTEDEDEEDEDDIVFEDTAALEEEEESVAFTLDSDESEEMDAAFAEVSGGFDEADDQQDEPEIEELADEDISVFLEESEEMLETEIEAQLLGDSQSVLAAQDFDEITHPEDNTDYIVSVDGPLSEEDEEDEVIFEPVDEFEEELSLESAEGAAQQSSDDWEEDDLGSFGTVLLSDKTLPKSEKEVAEPKQEVEEAAAEEFIPSDIEIPPQDDSAYIDSSSGAQSTDDLTGLRNCIVSLGLEINDEILSSFSDEIERLRHLWMGKPVERSFVQLLATVSQHIDKHRYEADPEANKLLLSVFDKLEMSTMNETDALQMQEHLLGETSKVLIWQQKMVDRKAVSKSDAEDTGEALYDDAEKGAGETLLGVAGRDGDLSGVIEDIVDGIDDDDEKDAVIKMVSSIMKSEMDQLRSTFLQEIKDLKEEIRRGKG